MEVDALIYRSPKRKRGQATLNPTLTTSGLSQCMSTTNDSAEDVGSHSPSMRMTGKFQKMDLQSPIDFHMPTMTAEMPGLAFRCQPRVASDTPLTTATATATTTTATTTTTPPHNQTSPPQQFEPLESSDFTFESPIPRSADVSPTLTVSPSKRAKSPPPSTVVSDQFWHASEITGWTPDDPDEDNYGINGVGYAKTAAKAWSISQKRKQQIAEYRSRETREARQRRHERRLSGRNSRRSSPMPRAKSDESGKENRDGSRERKGLRCVHFEDG